jgi:lycopene cyclase domain-containing protein
MHENSPSESALPDRSNGRSEFQTLSAMLAPVIGTVSKIGQNAPMRNLSYLAMLIFTICGSFWLEIFLKVGVLKRYKRVLRSIVPVATIFLLWDAFAISSGHWKFDPTQIIGVFGPGGIPLEEYLFFLIIPIAAIMTLEAVRRVKGHWPVGDEK